MPTPRRPSGQPCHLDRFVLRESGGGECLRCPSSVAEVVWGTAGGLEGDRRFEHSAQLVGGGIRTSTLTFADVDAEDSGSAFVSLPPAQTITIPEDATSGSVELSATMNGDDHHGGHKAFNSTSPASGRRNTERRAGGIPAFPQVNRQKQKHLPDRTDPV